MPFPVRMVFALALMSIALAAPLGRSAQAQSISFGYCPVAAASPHEGFAHSIKWCEDLARKANLRALPETSARVWFALGQLYHFDHQYDKAAQSYTKSLGWQHKWPNTLLARADAYAALGKDDLARQDYAAAAELLPRPTPEDLGRRCWLRAMRGGPLEPALADCETAIAAKPDDAHFLFARCVVRYRLGRFQPAAADCDAAVTRNSRMTGALYVGGLAKLKSGDTAGGEADIAEAQNKDSSVADTFELFGLTR